MTYNDIVEYVLKKHKRWIHTCWIAHVKEMNGQKVRRAPNRFPGGKRANPCPHWARALIDDAIKQSKMT